MPSPRNIVVTGSTRGIGYGLAHWFLRLGCTVTTSGRSKESTVVAIEELKREHAPERVHGVACDVTVED